MFLHIGEPNQPWFQSVKLCVYIKVNAVNSSLKKVLKMLKIPSLYYGLRELSVLAANCRRSDWGIDDFRY